MEVLHRLHYLARFRVSLFHVCLVNDTDVTRFTYLYFFLVETKGRNGHQLPLEEISALFDGDDVKEDITRSSEAAILDKPQKTDLAKMESGLGSNDNVNVTQIEKVDDRR